MDGSLLSDADLGLSYPATAGGTSAPDDMAGRELTVHRSAPAPVVAPMPAAAPVTAAVGPAQDGAPAAPAAPKLLSDEDLGIAPHQTGILSNAPDDGYLSGAAKGIGTAAVKAVGNSGGFVGGLGGFADYLVARAEHAITGKPVETILGDLAKAKKAQEDHAAGLGIPAISDPRNVMPAPADVSAPILKRTGEYVPTSEPGKLAQAGTEAALSVLGPGGGAKVGTMGEVLRGAAAMAPGNFAGGAIGQGVTDVTGDPLLGAAAGLGAGAAAQGGAATVKKLGAPMVMGVPGIDSVPIVGPRVATARDSAATSALLRQSSDPAALRDWAAQPATPSDVTASPQTTAGAVGNDRGLFQAEKDARNVNNVPFNAVDAAQSAAQQGAIRAVQPDGDVFRPGQVIRDRLDAIDQAAQAAEDRLNAAHQDAATRRTMDTQAFADQQRADLADRTIARGQASGEAKAEMDAATQAAHDRLVQSFQDAHAKASQAATDAAAPLRDLPPAEQTGAALRAAQSEATAAAKQARDELYRAVDPDGTLATVVTPLKEAKNTIRAAIDPHTGVEPSGAEAKLWSDIDRLPDVVPFRSLQKLDSRVTAAMADARRNPNPQDPEAISRLTQLKSATMDAIHQGVENQAAHEARLVEAGLMPAEDSFEARFAREAQDFADARRLAARGVAATGTGPDRAGGSATVYPTDGSQIQSGRGPGNASRNQGLQGSNDDGLAPNFTPEASERLTAAKAAHAAYAQTFKNPTVRGALETNGFAGQYRTPDSAIPSKWIVQGDKGYETAQAFLAASANDPRGIAAMQDAALAPLRKNVPPVGNLHPNALARFKEAYGGALRAIDEVSPGFSGRFDNAANATQALLDLGVEQKQALAASQRQAAKDAFVANAARREELGQATAADRAQVASLLAERAADDRAAIGQSKAETAEGIGQARGIARDARATPAGQFAGQGGDRIAPAEVENAVGNMLKTGTQGAARMRSLVASVGKDVDALAGLRKAGVDWMLRSFQNADGAMSGAKFISFVRDNKDTLRELYGTAHVSMFGAVARDLEANARWRTETAIKGGSDTAKNMLPMIEKAVDDTKKHISIGAAATAGFLAGGPKGALGGAGLYLLNNLRSAGIRSVDDLYREALLDPEKARLLISKMPETAEGGKLRALTGLLRRGLIVGQQQTAINR